jgi:hypothetical protein
MNLWQRDKVWEALDRVRFHAVVERPARPSVFVVVELNWEYNDNWYDACVEADRPLRAFRNRANAEAFRDLLEEEKIRENPYLADRRLEITDRVVHRTDPLGLHEYESVFADEREGSRYYEVIEVEMGA